MNSVEKLAKALEKQFSVLSEDVSASKNKFNIEAATSYELDMISSFFKNVSRDGGTDEELRQKIYEAIAVEGSLGTIDVLINTIKLLTGADYVRIHKHGGGTFTVELTGEITPGSIENIHDLPAAGCGINWIHVVYPETFKHDQAGVGLDQGEMA